MKHFKLVTKADLKGFDKEAQELLLWAQEQGARIRVSNRRHALVYGPDGVSSTSVARNMKSHCRTAHNARAAVARLFA